MNIRKFRELKKISQSQMAMELGISGSNYSKMERGDIDLTVSRLTEIAKILHVEINQILDFDEAQIFSDTSYRLPGQEQIQVNDYREKYIKMLEDEVERLKKELKEK